MPEQHPGLQRFVVVITDDAGVRHERVSLPRHGDADLDSQAYLLIGRGWHCDLIVQDPLVDAEHARVSLDEAGLVRIEDLNSLNGLHLTSAEPQQVELVVGTTRLEFHRADEAVAPAVRPSRWEAARARLANPFWPLLALVLVISIQSYLGSAAELKADRFVSANISMLVGCGIWALFWGLVSKLLRNSMQMASHFSVICWGLFAAWLLGEVSVFFGWQTQSLGVEQFLDVLTSAGWLFLIAMVTLGIATQLRSRALLMVAAVPSLMLVFYVYGMPLLRDEPPQWGTPIVSESYPPSWQWSEGAAVADFLEASSAVFDLSAERAAERAAELAEVAR